VYWFKLKKLVTSKDIFESATKLLITEARVKVEKIKNINASKPASSFTADEKPLERSSSFFSLDHANKTNQQNKMEFITRSPRDRCIRLEPKISGLKNSN
jgi:hypothetical protein